MTFTQIYDRKLELLTKIKRRIVKASNNPNREHTYTNVIWMEDYGAPMKSNKDNVDGLAVEATTIYAEALTAWKEAQLISLQADPNAVTLVPDVAFEPMDSTKPISFTISYASENVPDEDAILDTLRNLQSEDAALSSFSKADGYQLDIAALVINTETGTARVVLRGGATSENLNLEDFEAAMVREEFLGTVGQALGATVTVDDTIPQELTATKDSIAKLLFIDQVKLIFFANIEADRATLNVPKPTIPDKLTGPNIDEDAKCYLGSVGSEYRARKMIGWDQDRRDWCANKLGRRNAKAQIEEYISAKERVQSFRSLRKLEQDVKDATSLEDLNNAWTDETNGILRLIDTFFEDIADCDEVDGTYGYDAVDYTGDMTQETCDAIAVDMAQRNVTSFDDYRNVFIQAADDILNMA